MKEKSFALDLTIDPLEQKDFRKQLVEQLREQIKTGRIPAGTKLPTIKKLASTYNIGDNTVRAILNQLDSEGLIVKRRKLGTFVRNISSATGNTLDGIKVTILFRPNPHEEIRKNSLSSWEYSFIHSFESLACLRGISVSLAAINEDLTGETDKDQEKINQASGYLALLKQPEPQQTFVENLDRLKRPVVICNYYDTYSGMRINEDWVWGTRELLSHLVKLGHQKIALCSLPAGSHGKSCWIKQREDAFISQASFLGLKTSRKDIFSATPETAPPNTYNTDQNSGITAGRKLFSRNLPYTAIIAINLDVAHGIKAAAEEVNIKIPQDISLATYDDNDIALLNGLTTIMRDKLSDARDATRLLLESITNPTMNRAVTIVNKPLLIIRDSTAPPCKR